MKKAQGALGLAVVVALLILAGCKKDENPVNNPPAGGNVTVSGVVHSFGGQAIANAVVQFYSGTTTTGTPAAMDTASATGQWQLTVAAGRYTYVVGAATYPTAVVTVNVPSGQSTLDVGTTTLASQTINGIINDAQTGVPIANATVRFFSGSSNDTSGYRFPDLTTNGTGAWSGAFTLGSYVCAVYASSRIPLVTNVPVTDTTTTQLTITVTQPVPTGQMRIVLNWGAEPSDLDSHLTGDSTTVVGHPRYHVYYANREVLTASGDTIAYLDHDDVTSFGPETITIFRFFPGTLRYKIHDYSNRSGTGSHYMSDSSAATVRVYTSAGLVREDHILRGVAGNQWYVYDINGTNQQITFINTIRDGVSNPADSSFRPLSLPPKNVGGR